MRDIAGLYIYDNTLAAALMTGAELREYLEWSARFFVQVTEDEPWDPETHTNALYDGATRGIPDYNFDAITGDLTYQIDITKPVGKRVVSLKNLDGSAVTDDQQFVMAVNNYRQAGGGGYPVMSAIWDEQLEIRQLIIEYAQEVREIDQENFHVKNWELITVGVIRGVDTVDNEGAGVVVVEAADNIEHCGLTGPRRTQNRDELIVAKCNRYVV